MALLPPRQGKMVSPENPGYRPTKEFLAAADRSHARGTATHAGGAVLRAKQGGLLLSRPLQIAQLSLQDVRRGAVTSLDILRAGRLAVLCFWATGVGGGVDPQVPCHTPANTRKHAGWRRHLLVWGCCCAQATKWSGSVIPHDP